MKNTWRKKFVERSARWQCNHAGYREGFVFFICVLQCRLVCGGLCAAAFTAAMHSCLSPLCGVLSHTLFHALLLFLSLSFSPISRLLSRWTMLESISGFCCVAPTRPEEPSQRGGGLNCFLALLLCRIFHLTWAVGVRACGHRRPCCCFFDLLGSSR